MIDWQELFIPTHPILEIILRGTLTYIMLFLILRFFLKRQSGVIGIADLLVIVLIADAAQNAMASEYKSITEAEFSFSLSCSGITRSIGSDTAFPRSSA
jgi:uncharacterized membrane protein YcaP (DUF421 family)